MMIILLTELNVDYMDQPTDMNWLNIWFEQEETTTITNVTFPGSCCCVPKFVTIGGICASGGILVLDKWYLCFTSDDHYTAPVWITVDRFSNWQKRSGHSYSYHLRFFFIFFSKVDGRLDLVSLAQDSCGKSWDRWAFQVLIIPQSCMMIFQFCFCKTLKTNKYQTYWSTPSSFDD